MRQKFIAQGAHCAICGSAIQDPKDLTVDHKIPKSKGGTDRMSNLQPAHNKCNEKKGNKLDWRHAISRHRPSGQT